MTQITFSPGELFSMTMISLGLAVFFAALTFIIAVSSRRGALAAVDKSVIQKGLSRLWRRISIVIRIRQKAEYEHMEEQRLKLINQVIQLSQEANEKAKAVRQQELQAWEQLQAEKVARSEPTSRLAEPPESSLFRLGPLESDPIRLPPYRGPKDLKAWLFPPRREIPSFFFFRDAEVKDKPEDKNEG
ncbi:unnamed protein product [Dibothriocephalus latus]|uniref:Uncharacterized protein n=1 Tax=Dibothriocephalus latus TaxID=60516 RepID=A0A3P6SUF9_DIBLA|nr:unnamed protein product [Dibothriocephalus latus]